jgi:hypothetical protein
LTSWEGLGGLLWAEPSRQTKWLPGWGDMVKLALAHWAISPSASNGTQGAVSAQPEVKSVKGLGAGDRPGVKLVGDPLSAPRGKGK